MHDLFNSRLMCVAQSTGYMRKAFEWCMCYCNWWCPVTIYSYRYLWSDNRILCTHRDSDNNWNKMNLGMCLHCGKLEYRSLYGRQWQRVRDESLCQCKFLNSVNLTSCHCRHTALSVSYLCLICWAISRHSSSWLYNNAFLCWQLDPEHLLVWMLSTCMKWTEDEELCNYGDTFPPFTQAAGEHINACMIKMLKL